MLLRSLSEYILKQLLFFSISVNSSRIFTLPLCGLVNTLPFNSLRFQRIIIVNCSETQNVSMKWQETHLCHKVIIEQIGRLQLETLKLSLFLPLS